MLVAPARPQLDGIPTQSFLNLSLSTFPYIEKAWQSIKIRSITYVQAANFKGVHALMNPTYYILLWYIEKSRLIQNTVREGVTTGSPLEPQVRGED